MARQVEIPRAVQNLREFASGQCHLLETSNQLSDAGKDLADEDPFLSCYNSVLI